MQLEYLFKIINHKSLLEKFLWDNCCLSLDKSILILVYVVVFFAFFLLDMEWIVTIFGVSYSYTKPRTIDFKLDAEKYSRNDTHWTVTVDGPLDIVLVIKYEDFNQ